MDGGRADGTPGQVPLVATGDDPVWTLWCRWAAARGIAFAAPDPNRALPVPPDGAGLVVLASPWDCPGAAAVEHARSLLAPGLCADVWLLGSGPSPQLQAEVLAAGGRGCLPRLPDAVAVERARRLARWWPSPPGPAPARGTPTRGAGSGPAAGPAEPWWAWPRATPLTIVAPWPLEARWAEGALEAWRRARGAHPASCLGTVPAPIRGRTDPAVAAAATGAVAVVVAADWAVLVGARTLLAALRAAGATELRVWLMEAPAGAPTGELARALGAPCSLVPRGRADPDAGSGS